MKTVFGAAVAATVLCATPVVVEATIDGLPPWPPTYNMSMSTLTMTCNGSGWSNPVRGAQFGITSYDWSNAKKQWAAAKPMDCEERLLTQAKMTKELNPDTHVFVYRNLVKALPWFTTVREKLDDPQYAGFFLKFDPKPPRANDTYYVPNCAFENKTKCSVFYHDQEQTPQVPGSIYPVDGECTDNECDCGANPCGEYLWDHRNGSMLRDFLLDEVIMGPTGVGSPAIDGLFIDDFWCSDLLCEATNNTYPYTGCPCSDPVQGPTEINAHSQADMGLSDYDIAQLTVAWAETLEATQKRLLDNGAYTWSLFHRQYAANASPQIIDQKSCDYTLRDACTDSPDNVWQTTAMLHGMRVNGTTLVHPAQDVAAFLLARGDYAYLGWGVWGMGWPFNPEPAHGTVPPQPGGVPRYHLMDADFGHPVDKVCEPIEGSPGAYQRRWSKATIKLDCNSYEAVFNWTNGTVQTFAFP